MIGRRAVIVVSLMAAAASASAQDLSRYREYALGMSVASIVTSSGGRDAEVRTIHVRPARIQTFLWRTSYMRPPGAPADPVRDLQFSFFNDQLYRAVVTYDRARTEGLTNDDVIAAMEATYGEPGRLSPAPPGDGGRADVPSGAIVLAQWEDAASRVVLTRDASMPVFQLILTSKATSEQARVAIAEAVRLDAVEAPQRELDRRTDHTTAAAEAAADARAVNKGAFRP
jgi:hypothetical protein